MIAQIVIPNVVLRGSIISGIGKFSIGIISVEGKLIATKPIHRRMKNKKIQRNHNQWKR
jgi:hypothetical protein